MIWKRQPRQARKQDYSSALMEAGTAPIKQLLSEAAARTLVGRKHRDNLKETPPIITFLLQDFEDRGWLLVKKSNKVSEGDRHRIATLGWMLIVAGHDYVKILCSAFDLSDRTVRTIVQGAFAKENDEEIPPSTPARSDPTTTRTEAPGTIHSIARSLRQMLIKRRRPNGETPARNPSSATRAGPSLLSPAFNLLRRLRSPEVNQRISERTEERSTPSPTNEPAPALFLSPVATTARNLFTGDDQQANEAVDLPTAINLVDAVPETDVKNFPLVVGLAVKILDKRKVSGEKSIQFSYKALADETQAPKLRNKLRKKTYVEIAPAMGSRNKNETRETRMRRIRRWAAPVSSALKALGGTDNELIQKEVLDYIIGTKKKGVVLWGAKSVLSVVDVIALRKITGHACSTGSVVRLLQGTASLLGIPRLIQTRLRAKISHFEYEHAVPAEFFCKRLMTSKDKSASCVYYYIKNVPLLLERMVVSTFVEGKQQDSIEISNHRNAHLMAFGADRGGGDCLNMARYMNRKDGNTGQHSMPIGVAENATEDYENLAQTIYRDEDRLINEDILNRELHLIEIQGTDLDGAPVAKAILVKFELPESSSFDRENLDVSIIQMPNDDNPLLDDGVVRAVDRSRLTSLSLDESDLQEKRVSLGLQLVGRDERIGCRVFAGDRCILAFEFDLPFHIKGNVPVKLKCQKVIGFLVVDGKLCNTVLGLSTCNVLHPCPRCTIGLQKWVLPKYFEEFKSQDEFKDLPPNHTFKDFGMRTGEHSYTKCLELFEDDVGVKGSNTHAIGAKGSQATKEKSLSVSKKPLLNIKENALLSGLSGEPMHLVQGTVTHLINKTSEKLGEIEKGFLASTKISQLEKEVKEIENLQKSSDYRKAAQQWRKHKKIVKAAEKALLEAENEALLAEKEAAEVEDDGSSSDDDSAESEVLMHEAIERQDNIMKLEAKFVAAQAELEKVDDKFGFGIYNRRIRGAKLLRKALSETDESKSMNEAQFLFLQTLRRVAGGFNKQHGGMELTNARRMRALSRREEIVEKVCTAFRDDAVKNAKVKEIMDMAWNQLASRLDEIAKILKSQEKIGPEKLKTYCKCTAEYGVLWRKFCPLEKIYWKLHMLECAMSAFIEEHGLAGLASAEGFENTHHTTKAVTDMLRPIASTSVRIQKMTQRHQIILMPGIVDVIAKIQKAKRVGGPRGPYEKKPGTGGRGEEEVHIVEEEQIDDDAPPEGYVTIEDDGLIPDEYAEVYNFIKLSKAPEDWATAINEDDSLGNKAKHESLYF